MEPKEEYDPLFKTLFEELRRHWVEQLSSTNESGPEDLQSKLALSPESKTFLCFFVIPNEIIPMYQRYVYPIFEARGLTIITSADIKSTNKNIIALTASVVEKSAVVVIDATYPKSSYMYELDLALEGNQYIIVIIEKTTEVPSELHNPKISLFKRPSLKEPSLKERANIIPFIKDLEGFVAEISPKLHQKLSSEPERLLSKGEYRSAVISAFILLEVELHEKLRYKLLGLTRSPSIRKLIEIARHEGYMNFETYSKLNELISVRNGLIHTNKTISAKDATDIVKEIHTTLEDLKSSKVRAVIPAIDDQLQVDHISFDDPDRDFSIIKNNLMRELCERDSHARRNGKPTEFLMVDIWESSLAGFELKYLEGRIKEFESTSSYIRLLSNGKITLTDSGRKQCHQFLSFK